VLSRVAVPFFTLPPAVCRSSDCSSPPSALAAPVVYYSHYQSMSWYPLEFLIYVSLIKPLDIKVHGASDSGCIISVLFRAETGMDF
jgi:hypothetical protein